MPDTAYLVLENGKIFKGKSFGHEGEIIAETVFATGMTGYLETLTDKNHFGQIVVQTFPLIGNYGVIPSDFESDTAAASAYIVKHWCQEPSNFRSEGNIDAFLKSQKIVGLCGIDTRALTKIIRENGVMNGMITKTPDSADMGEIKAYKAADALRNVSTKKPYYMTTDNGKYNIALLDLGFKNSIAGELLKRSCNITVLPYDTGAREILGLKPDGIVLSNGPGGPAANVSVTENVKELLRSGVPIFGICLGHLILALASGFTVEKMKCGHRGSNQPVKDLSSGRVYIAGQNHGYAVVSGSIDGSIAKESFVNVNDSTCEGIEYRNCHALSVQFVPGGSLWDTAFLFDRFIKMMDGATAGEVRNNAAE